MILFTSTFKLTQTQRRALLGMALIVAMTSTNVQAAGASEVLPQAPVWTEETKTDQNDLKLVVPVIKAPVLAKKKWNTVNAPDLETKPSYSSEPAVRTIVVPVSAYNSEVGQTDSSPFTTADGTRVRDGIVAANFLKHGTRFRIPDYFGDKVFEVHDRMNARYTYKIDIWMLNKADARAWGVRKVNVEILP